MDVYGTKCNVDIHCLFYDTDRQKHIKESLCSTMSLIRIQTLEKKMNIIIIFLEDLRAIKCYTFKECVRGGDAIKI